MYIYIYTHILGVLALFPRRTTTGPKHTEIIKGPVLAALRT